MNETVHLKNSNLPKMIGDLMHSNQFLKLFAVIAGAIAILSMIVAVGSLNKAPMVIPLNPNGNVIDRAQTPPKPEVEIESAIRRYLDLRYRWEPKTIQSQIKEAQKFIAKDALKAFQSATAPILRFSSEKQVSQRVYPTDRIAVNLDQKAVFVTGDRVTEIQGLRAVGNLKLTLSFESGSRTAENPWGIYITKEREEQ